MTSAETPNASFPSLAGPPNPAPIILQLNLRGALSVGFFGVLLTIFVMAFIDTMGSLIGVSARAGFLDAHGNLPQIERPMLADAIATMFAGLAGTTALGIHCPNLDAWHILASHLGVAVIGAVVGLVVGWAAENRKSILRP